MLLLSPPQVHLAVQLLSILSETQHRKETKSSLDFLAYFLLNRSVDKAGVIFHISQILKLVNGPAGHISWCASVHSHRGSSRWTHHLTWTRCFDTGHMVPLVDAGFLNFGPLLLLVALWSIAINFFILIILLWYKDDPYLWGLPFLIIW